MAEQREANRARNTSTVMDLRGRCSQALQQLEEAVGGVLNTEKQLRVNATEVRGQVQSMMSRQQEALRCRELWLLGQIELLEQIKSETLQQQVMSLTRVQSQLDLISEQINKQPISNELQTHLTNQLSPLLDSVSSLSLTPEETPDLCFHGDARSLRSAITSYGSVTSSENSPAPKRQKTGGAVSQWLLGAEPQSVYKGNQSSETRDWLMTSSMKQVAPPLLCDVFSSWAGQVMDLEAWLVKETTPLCDDICGVRRRSVSVSTSSSFEEIDQSELSVEEIDQSELSVEEIDRSEPSAEEIDRSASWGAVLRPFEEPWESSDWLLRDCSLCTRPQGALEIENLGQTLGRLRCLKSHDQSQTKDQSHTEDRTRDQSKTQAQTQDRTSDQSPKKNLSRSEALEAWLQKVAPVSQVCKANSACASLRSCVCEENCGRDALRAWLLKREGRDKNGIKTTPTEEKTTLTEAKDTPNNEKDTPNNEKDTPNNEKDTPTVHKDTPPVKKMPLSFSEREEKVQAILEAWLHPPTSHPAPSSVAKEMIDSCPFRRPLQADLWVAPSKAPSNQTPERSVGLAHSSPDPAHSSPDPDHDRWLLRKRSNAQERVCDLFSCMKINKDTDLWLHPPTIQM